jgi:hypothetical protein
VDALGAGDGVDLDDLAVGERLSRSQVTCTASSASVSEPSIR